MLGFLDCIMLRPQGSWKLWLKQDCHFVRSNDKKKTQWDNEAISGNKNE